MHITLRQLEVFAEVHKSGSTTQASQMLALSQSAVSAALTDLEGQLGVQLFDRVGKRLVVNEHGRLLYPRALALLERALEIEQLFRGDNGAIRVYASSTIGNRTACLGHAGGAESAIAPADAHAVADPSPAEAYF